MNLLKKYFLLAVVPFLSVGMSSCGMRSERMPDEGSSIAVNEIDSPLKYHLLFVDGLSDQLISDVLNVEFNGDAILKDSLGGLLNGKSIQTTDGIVALGAEYPSKNSSFSVQVGNRSLGWIETGVRIVASSSDVGDREVKVKIFNVNSASQINSATLPVSMATSVGSVDGQGFLMNAVTLSTISKNIENAESLIEPMATTRITFPSQVQGLTSQGVPAAGNLTMVATMFSNASEDSLQSFPGGFIANVSAPSVELAGVSDNAGAFITGGFAQFNVTDGLGRSIKKFDKPISVSIDLPKGSKNLDDVELSAGDTYPVWSYDDSLGVWNFEANGEITEKTPFDPNFFQVSFSTQHLSSWNLDHYGSTCDAIINFTGRPAGDVRPLDVVITGLTGQRFSHSLSISDSQLNLVRIVRAAKVRVVVRDAGKIVGSKTNIKLCDASPITVPMSLPIVTTGKVRVEVSEACPDGSDERALSTFVSLSGQARYSPAYARVESIGATVASKTFASVRPGVVTVRVQNPRATTKLSRYITKSVQVTANTSLTVPFRFDRVCPTGATGANATIN